MKKVLLSFITFVFVVVLSIQGVNAEEFSDTFKKMFPTDTYEMKSIPIKNDIDADVLFYGKLFNKFWDIFDENNYNIEINNCNDDYTKCDIRIYRVKYEEVNPGVWDYVIDTENPMDEKHVINFTYEEYNPEIAKIIDKYIQKVSEGINPDYPKLYNISDLNLINYYSTIKNKEKISDLNNALNYSIDLRKEFEHAAITYSLDVRAGDDIAMHSFAFGFFIAEYNGIAYGYVDPIGVQKNNIIYIPDDTENSKEAYIKAAKDRIEKYLGIEIKIESAGKRSDYNWEEQEGYDPINAYGFSQLGDESKMGDYYYYITINGIKYEFVIIRDSAKMQEIEYKSKDLINNVEVSSNDSSIPLDTIVITNVIDNIDEYKEKLKTDNVFAIDIDLKSVSNNEYIKKLDNGKFLVTLPVPEIFEGKNIVAYYINSKGELERHEITVKDKIASFVTDHFSAYAIVEDNLKISEDNVEDNSKNNVIIEDNVENPKTSDAIAIYLVTGVISLAGLFGMNKLKKKYN